MPRLLLLFNKKFASKWLIFLVDLLICTVTFSFAVIIHHDFAFATIDAPLYWANLLLVLGVRALFFLYFRSFEGIIRHTSIEDALLMLKVITLGSVAIIFLSNFAKYNGLDAFYIPLRITIVSYFMTLFAIILSRFLVKSIFDNFMKKIKSETPVIIYGTGYMGLITKNSLMKDHYKKYKVLCFVDDNPQKVNKTIEGIKILSRQAAMERYILNPDYNGEVEVMFAIQNISPVVKAKIAEEFLNVGVIMKSIPHFDKWIKGELTSKQIHNIEIDELLERESIKINNRMVESFIKGKKILVTGAAGSIGSELVRQLIRFAPQRLILVDQAESALYDVEMELHRMKDLKGFCIDHLRAEVFDVTNEALMNQLFKEELPEVVFHAAAYKHVPLMEKNPYQAVRINVFGTKTVADLASKYKVEKFVMISTDKAVNPTNVMGATKRLAEMYVQGLNAHFESQTRFIVTRFGNVLGSNGSVIPLFKKQIEQGGPLTVTHPDIIRYFMTIPEACQLVLEAGTMGKGGEVYVFDMGEPVKIVDLAKKMVQLSGLKLGIDIDIQFTGLRPGEKLYEELLHTSENTIPTYHHKILIAKVVGQDFEVLVQQLNQFKHQLGRIDARLIVSQLKKLIPEYISKNSEYESLDLENRSPDTHISSKLTGV